MPTIKSGLLGSLSVLALTCAMAGAAVATPIYTVDVWIGDLSAEHTGGTNASPPLPTPAADAHFTFSGPVDWFTAGKNASGQAIVGDFFQKDDPTASLAAISGFSSPSSQYSSLTKFLADIMSKKNTAKPAAFFHLAGSYTSLGSYAGSIQHDDGASLYIDNGSVQIFSNPAETSVVTDNFTLPGGTHNFDIYYVEAGGAPAELTVNFPNGGEPPAIPEPAPLAVFGSGLAGLALARRRRA